MNVHGTLTLIPAFMEWATLAMRFRVAKEGTERYVHGMSITHMATLLAASKLIAYG